MGARVWTLPNGAKVRFNGGIEMQYPGKETWFEIARNLEDAENLLASLAVEVPRARRSQDFRERAT